MTEKKTKKENANEFIALNNSKLPRIFKQKHEPLKMNIKKFMLLPNIKSFVSIMKSALKYLRNRFIIHYTWVKMKQMLQHINLEIKQLKVENDNCFYRLFNVQKHQNEKQKP